MSFLPKPSRIDFEKIDPTSLNRILSTGDLECLTPEEREYFSFMEMVRGLRARMLLPGGRKIVTKAGIIKLLKNNYGFSDWMARRIYDGAINFLYSGGKFKGGRALMNDAAKLRGCFYEATPEIPEELLQPRTVIIYTSNAAALGAPSADRRELEAFIDEIPEIPQLTCQRVKEDAGILPKNLLKRMAEDVKEFTDETD